MEPKKVAASWPLGSVSEQELRYFKVALDLSIQRQQHMSTYNREQEQLSFRGYFRDKTTTFHHPQYFIWFLCT
jgi:hypothetical protein